MEKLLSLKNLRKWFALKDQDHPAIAPGWIRAVDGVDLDIGLGETIGLMGTPYSGASILGLLILRKLLPTSGAIIFRGEDLARSDKLETREKMDKRGIFNLFSSFRYPIRPPHIQEAECSLEVVTPLDPKTTKKIYRDPPRLIVADTSLSPSIQTRKQIEVIIMKTKTNHKTSTLLITQDIGSITRSCDKIAVMYCGKIVEYVDVRTFLKEGLHPYCKGLLIYETFLEFSETQSIDIIDMNIRRAIQKGSKVSSHSKYHDNVNLLNPPSGCRFHTRCPEYIGQICKLKQPPIREVSKGYYVACHLYA